MTKIFTRILLGVAFFFLISVAKAQDQYTQKKMDAAVNAYKHLKFVDAIEALKLVLAKSPKNIDAMEMMANSYRLTKQYGQALEWYTKLSQQSFTKPDWALRYAEALANNKEYEKSEIWYRKYLSIVPSDRRAALFSEADFDKLGKGVNWDIRYLSINTPASEYAPMIYKEGMIFSSNRQDKKPVKYVFGWNNTPFTDLYLIKDRKKIKDAEAGVDDTDVKANLALKAGKFNDDNTAPTSNDTKILGTYDPKMYGAISASDKLNEVVKLNKNINTRFHEGSSALVSDGSLMFTRNNFYKSKSAQSSEGIIKLKLYTAEGYNWKNIVPFEYNNNEYSVGHPSVSKDGKILIFASDMPGGLGGVDLYFCIRLTNDSPWSRPVNFGSKINTEGDEEFPYLDNYNKLYFSSNGWPGLGGLDVFSVIIDDLKATTTPENLGPPLNSPLDDFAVALTNDSTGYFSSNRRGNDDIYSFKKKVFKIILKGRVIDGITGAPLPNATVLLKNGEIENNLILNPLAQFEKELSKGTGYELDGLLKDYLPDRRYIATDGIDKDTTIYVELSLKRTSKIQQYVINNCDSLKRVFNTNNIYYDLDKYNIRPDAYENLDQVVELMKKYPAIEVISRSHTDSRASESYNRTLSYNRGESAKRYLIAKGIDKNRISVQYFGKSRLVNRCKDGIACTEEEQQMNRRTEFEVIYNGINLSLIDCK
ncbi:MAG: OmpA family protein [Candidatus Dojkabacteria bacterium]